MAAFRRPARGGAQSSLADPRYHLTALNYLRQLELRDLPLFNLGLTRALERLAVYRATSVEKPPSTRAGHGVSIDERPHIDRAQILNQWDVLEAGAAYDRLMGRAHAVDPRARTTEAVDVKDPPSRPGAWVERQMQRLVEVVADRAASARKKQRGVGVMSTADKPEVQEQRSGISGVPMYVAIAAVLVWVAFIVVMLASADAEENTWTRLTFIFASVEAIAFAAAGALFGVTVQRERVEKAEEKAEKNESEAASGRALAAINLADEGQVVEQDSESAFESYGPSQVREADVRRRHAEAARRLFPNL